MTKKQGHALIHNPCAFIWAVNAVISQHCTDTAENVETAWSVTNPTTQQLETKTLIGF